MDQILNISLLFSTIVSDRDNSCFECVLDGKDDESYFYSLHTVEHSKMPEEENVIRCTVGINVFFIQEAGDDKCKITRIAQTDVKGSIPPTFLNWFMGIQHESYTRYKNILES